MSTRIGFAGCGRMAQALAKGWIQAGVVRAEDLLGYEISPEAGEAARALGVTLVNSNADLARPSDVLILAVKPQSMADVASELKGHLESRHLVVSIAAGITLDRLLSLFGEGIRLVRVMPNTPCLVGAAASGFTPSPTATAEDAALVERLFNSVGIAYRVSEGLLDAVTGLSGSGPAFLYLVIEALSDGGVKAGLPRDVATALAAQTVLGAARMVLETGLHPGELKDMVTSPGGTTIAGLAALEQHGVRAAFIDAVTAAAHRSQELGNASKK